MSDAAERTNQPAIPEETAWDRFSANMRTIGGAVLLAIFIRIVLFEAFEIDGASMQPSLLHGDRVVVAKMLYGLYLPGAEVATLTWGAPTYGDVVIVHSPADGEDIVKRVVAMEGDRIAIRDGVIYRQRPGEHELTAISQEEVRPCIERELKEGEVWEECIVYEESYDDISYRISMNPGNRDDMEPREIPEGHVFVMGDHRDASNDSRAFRVGPIPFERIKGKALFLYMSQSHRPSAEGFAEGLGIRWDRVFAAVR